MSSPNTTAEDNSLDDTSGGGGGSGSGTAANNSILAKVKSTVKGILPNTLSKWFSPGPHNRSSLDNDTSNDHEHRVVTSQRRPRAMLEEEEEDDQSDSENDSENSDNVEGGSNQAGNLVIRGRRSINQQTKRRRIDSSELMSREEDTSVIGRQPLTASTPAASNSTKTRRAHLARSQCTRSDANHYRHLNTKKIYQNEPPYNFPDMIQVPIGSTTPTSMAIFGSAAIGSEASVRATSTEINEYMSPRRILNLPSSGTSSPLHRAPLFTAYDLPSTSNNAAFMRSAFGGASTPAKSIRDSMPITSLAASAAAVAEEDPLIVATNNNKYNGNANLSKRLKLVNGSGESSIHSTEDKSGNVERLRVGVTGIGGVERASNTNETPSEYSDGERSSNLAKSNNSRHSSRNSLLNATGINFNAHLEGRKSLFSTSQLNKNSTMSLNTIHQNNFNRKMFGSSSALSDSRLMKKLSSSSRSSPKITTMYGGPNANIRYLDSGAGAGTSNVTPTQMRPTSSLPSLNSTNSMALRGSLVGSASPHISNTTKDILNIMNNIKTPLDEARKMGSSLMRTPPSHRNRLSDADLHKSRLLRSEGVRLSPYGRLLKPTDKNRNSTITETSGGTPPVKELSIPTKAHLLKIKKLQTSTLELRQIALESDRNNLFNNEINLPINDNDDSNEPPPRLTKRKTKIKSVERNRKSEELMTLPEDLSTITFPNSKFNIEIPKFSMASSIASTTTSTNITSLQTTVTSSIPSTANASTSQSIATTTSILSSKPRFQFNSSSYTPAAAEQTSTTNGLKDNFKFSAPFKVKMNSEDAEEINTSTMVPFKFSKPLRACALTSHSSDSSTAVPKLKTGSCLEVFKISSSKTTATESNGICDDKSGKENLNTMFGSQFKKAAGEWECGTCLIRNKADVVKCIACETPKTGGSVSTASRNLNKGNTPGFGGAFKPKPNSWECPTCLINNKCDHNVCIACDTKKPGSTDTANQATTASAPTPAQPAFNFGFASTSAAGLSSTTTTTVKPPITQDNEFKKIAASQKSSSWECEACLTRNDSGRKKCICCEQAKPGTYLRETESTPSFKFGATATANFSFGFPASGASAIANIPTTNSSSVSSSTNAEKTENSPKKSATSGFSFGAVSSTSGGSPAGGFTFGIKSAVVTDSTNKDKETTGNKTETDGNKSGSTSLGGFKFGISSTDNVSSSTATAIPTLTPSTSGGFSFGIKSAVTHVKDTKPSNEAKVKEPEKPVSGGFSFVSPAAPGSIKILSNTTENAATTTITASNTTSTGSAAFGTGISTPKPFSFGSPSTTTAPTLFSSSISTVTTTVAATFSFGSSIATTASTSSTSTATNLFAQPATTTNTSPFGVNITSAESAAKTETSKVTTEPGFGFLGAGTSSAAITGNIFGSFNTPPSTKVAEISNSTTVTPIFGSTNTGTVTIASATTPIMFGTSGASTATTASSSSATSTFTTTNPINSSFVFGKTPATTEAPKSSIFGSFGTACNNDATTSNASTNLFGAAATQKSVAPPAFGQSLFNNNGETATTLPNIFGSPAGGVATSGSAIGQQNSPAFGATPTFGLGSASASSSIGGASTGFGNTFGGNTSATPTFGSFGSSDTSANKPEAFKFGDPGNVANTNMFSFGSSNNAASGATAIPKPAFNFGSSSNQPKGTFSFGATTAPAPSTTGGVGEAPTPNAPFQFNAASNAAPATNIFAPLPSGPQNAGQQAPRRKIRMAGRRITPR